MAETLPQFTQTAESYLNQTTVICGPSMSGKTTLANHIRELLKPHIGCEIIVSPTGGYISDSPQTAVLNSVRFPGGNTKDFLKQIVGDRARDSTSDPLLLIFDECIGDLKPHYRSEEFRALFYQARHLGITTVLCCQDDIDLDRNLSNYAGHSIYLTEYTALAGLDRSGVPKSTRERVREVAPPLFAKPGYPRLVWTDAEKFSQFTLGQ